MQESELIDLVNSNEKSIAHLAHSLQIQIEKYSLGNKISEGWICVEDDVDNVRDNLMDFYNHSQNFVDTLMEIRKNTLVVLQNFPDMNGWLAPQKEDDWDAFINDITSTSKRLE